MPEFLQVLTYQEAREMLTALMPAREWEYLPLQACNGRILALDLTSPEDMPAFHRSSVDGYAVCSADTFGSSEALPGMLNYRGAILIGSEPALVLERDQCAWIPTGGMVPRGSDAVVMVEYTEPLGDDTILVYRPAAPGENIMQQGEDIGRGQLLFNRDEILKAEEIGLLASLGMAAIPVFKPYQIGLLSTGDEVVPLEQVPKPGQVRDVNSLALGAALESCGVRPRIYPLVPDDPATLRQALDKACHENDLVIMSGGSSVGVADYAVQAILSLPDAKMLFHGLAVKPGKPTIAARVGPNLVIGLPGHPVSALMMFRILCAPLINPAASSQIGASLGVNLASVAGRDDFVPVKVQTTPAGAEAYPLLGKSGLMSTLAHADGYIHVPYRKQGLQSGDQVTVILF
jgi:molybdopterin molybdotransferase